MHTYRFYVAEKVMVVIFCLLTSGCAGLASSYDIRSATSQPVTGGVAGQTYSLPKATVRIALVRDQTGIALIVEQPRFVADSAASYVLSYRPSASSIDHLKVSVKDGLLSAINAEGDDQSAAIIEKLAETALLAEAAIDKSGVQTVFVATIDPADAKQVTRAEALMNLALERDVRPLLQRDCTAAIRTALAVDLPEDKKARQKKIATLAAQTEAKTPVCAAAANYQVRHITLNLDYVPFRLAGYGVASCEVGFCARALRPATITFLADGVPFASDQMHIPNGSQAIPYRLSRAVFAKETHVVTFENGSITSAEVTKGSEGLALASVPLNIIKGVFTTAAELVQLKVDLANKQKDLAVARKSKQDAEDALAGIKQAGAAEAALDPDTSLITTYIPGLGPNSGAGLPSAVGIANGADPKTDTPASKPDAPTQKPDAPTVPGADGAATGIDAGGAKPGGTSGGQVKGGNDGKKI